MLGLKAVYTARPGGGKRRSVVPKTVTAPLCQKTGRNSQLSARRKREFDTPHDLC